MIRLHSADRNDGVRALRLRFAHGKLELPRFVAAGCKSGAIISLDINVWSTEFGGQPR